jgi:hypothetical protein
MNCDICVNDADYLCSDCPELHFFCANHFGMHMHQNNHLTKKIDTITSKIYLARKIRSEIKQSTSRIIDDCQSMISAIRKISSVLISKLKGINKNIRGIKDFQKVSFDQTFINSFVPELNQKFRDLKFRFYPEAEEIESKIREIKGESI